MNKKQEFPLHKVVVMLPKMICVDTRVVAETMEGVSNKTKKGLQFALQVTNLIHGILGIPLLLYSVWMFIYGLENHTQYFFLSWFLWACMGLGTMLCLLSSMGFSAANSRRRSVLAYYLVLLFLQILVQVLIAADIHLNEQWTRDFPVDPTGRFESFVEFVTLHPVIFQGLGGLMFLSQVVSFFVALVLRTFFSRRSYAEPNDALATNVPFLNHGSSSTSCETTRLYSGYYMA